MLCRGCQFLHRTRASKAMRNPSLYVSHASRGGGLGRGDDFCTARLADSSNEALPDFLDQRMDTTSPFMLINTMSLALAPRSLVVKCFGTTQLLMIRARTRAWYFMYSGSLGGTRRGRVPVPYL